MPIPARPLLCSALAAAALAAVPPCTVAAPVDSGSAAGAPDPYQLAIRWTLASVDSGSAPPAAVAVAVPTAPRYMPLPRGVGGADGDGGVPDPAAYALMGALLLGVGLLARR